MAVTSGVFVEVLLVIVFGRIEVAQRLEFGDWLLPQPLLYGAEYLFDDGQVSGLHIIDSSAVAGADILSLTI